MDTITQFIARNLPALLAAIIALVGGLSIGIAVDDDGDGKPDRFLTATTKAEAIHQVKDAVSDTTVVDGPDADAKMDDVIPVGPRAQEVVASLAVEERDLAGELVGNEPVGPVAVLQAPFAAEEIPGCRTAFLDTNWSYRSVPQSMVIWYVPHYTAGRDIPNSRADVDGLTAYGNNPASRVSWNINMDKDGNCDYNVPLRYKSWAFGNANSYAINMEVHGSGEAPYLRAGGYKQLARIWKYVHVAYPQISLRIGSVSNCGPGSQGWVTHWMGGACSGGHTDIKPLSLPDVVDHVRAALADLNCGERCKKVRRQKKVIQARVARHDETHKRAKAEGCRSLDKNPPKAFGRPVCRDLKIKHRRQRRGIRRARATLKEIRG